jgi:hypothetical protein
MSDEVGCCTGQNLWGFMIGSFLCLSRPQEFVHTGMSGELCHLPVQVREVEDATVFVWGEYQGTLSEPGLVCLNPMGLELKRVSRQKQSICLDTVKIADKSGNPLLVRTYCRFQFTYLG